MRYNNTMNKTPALFTDADGSEWARNADGTYRCLSAEIRSLELMLVIAEFGPITFPAASS